MSKKLINSAQSVVDEAINAFVTSHPGLERVEDTNVVILSDIRSDRVALICGGGAGHEPAHVGFVAPGWLAAAVSGEVFASPPVSAVRAAIQRIAEKQGPQTSGNGILVVVKNYTGDVINFGYAVETAKLQGIRVAMIVVGDDVAFGVDHDGRRGIAGTVLAYKLLGAMANIGRSLEELVAFGETINIRLRSIGASLSTCSLPGQAASSVLPPHEMELGLGIHGERGMVRQNLCSASTCVKQLLERILVPEWNPAVSGLPLVVLLNNLGGTTDLEMSVLLGEVLKQLKAAGLAVLRVGCGRYMTALEMHGFSISILRLSSDEVSKFLDCPSSAPLCPMHAPQSVVPLVAWESAKAKVMKKPLAPVGPRQTAALHLFTHLESMEAHFNALDAAVGDGDLGLGVARACRDAAAVTPFLQWDTNVSAALLDLSNVIADAFAGTSGPLYGAFLAAAAAAVADTDELTATALRQALSAGCVAIAKVGGAARGDRTMLDVLLAVGENNDVLKASTVEGVLSAASTAAEEAARFASSLTAKKGRSRYLGGKEVGLPEPGCELAAAWLLALSRGSQ